MYKRSLCLGAALALLPLLAQGAEVRGIRFSHGEWEVVCDNTRTCRAAGYQDDKDPLPVSVLLTRKAGPGQPVSGELKLGSYNPDHVPTDLPAVMKLSMTIDGRPQGRVTMSRNNLWAALSPRQVAALLAALRGNTVIAWEAGRYQWYLSDRGARAVLLKMDEFQGRVGTRGALAATGRKGEEGVLLPLPMPEVMIPSLAKTLPRDEELAAAQPKALVAALEAALKEDDCPIFQEPQAGEDGHPQDIELAITRLSDRKLLVSTRCWSAAYNTGYAYWLIDDKPPYRPVLVTTHGTDYSDGIIAATHKGRGIGDCWSTDEWTWDGKQFLHTKSRTTGQCKLIETGGAWDLPEIVSNVRRSSP